MRWPEKARSRRRSTEIVGGGVGEEKGGREKGGGKGREGGRERDDEGGQEEGWEKWQACVVNKINPQPHSPTPPLTWHMRIFEVIMQAASRKTFPMSGRPADPKLDH